MFAMFHAHALREGHGHAHTNVTTNTRFAKNGITVLLCVYFQAVFRTIFFCLVCGAHLKKKKF